MQLEQSTGVWWCWVPTWQGAEHDDGAARPPSYPAGDPEPHPAPRRFFRVLIVDDYADTRDLYGSYLSAHGYHIDEAADGIEALAKLRTLRPDVILMDLAMPRLDGWRLTHMLKADPNTAAIPIIILTAHGTGTERDRAYAAGCDAFFTKPVTPKRVGQAVARALEQEPLS